MMYNIDEVYLIDGEKRVVITKVSKDFVKYGDIWVNVRNFEQFNRPVLVGHMVKFLWFFKRFEKL